MEAFCHWHLSLIVVSAVGVIEVASMPLALVDPRVVDWAIIIIIIIIIIIN